MQNFKENQTMDTGLFFFETNEILSFMVDNKLSEEESFFEEASTEEDFSRYDAMLEDMLEGVCNEARY